MTATPRSTPRPFGGSSTSGALGCWSRAAKGQKGGRWREGATGVNIVGETKNWRGPRQVTGPGLSPPAPHPRSPSLPSALHPPHRVPSGPPGAEAWPTRLGKACPRGPAVRASGRSAWATARAPTRRPGGRTHSARSSPAPGARRGGAVPAPPPSRSRRAGRPLVAQRRFPSEPSAGSEGSRASGTAQGEI